MSWLNYVKPSYLCWVCDMLQLKNIPLLLRLARILQKLLAYLLHFTASLHFLTINLTFTFRALESIIGYTGGPKKLRQYFTEGRTNVPREAIGSNWVRTIIARKPIATIGVGPDPLPPPLWIRLLVNLLHTKIQYSNWTL